MNLDYQVKELLRKFEKPISDFVLIDEYSKTMKFSNEEVLDFTRSYCKKDFPIQYMVGFEYFFDRRIMVNNNVLIPRMETEEVVLAAIEKIKEKYNDQYEEIKVLDMCTGSGAIIVGMDKFLGNYNVKYYAVDISLESLFVAEKNFKNYGIDVEIIQSDLFNEISQKTQFDVIVCNPPYLDKNQDIPNSVAGYEPEIALYASDGGTAMYNRIFKNVNKYLKKKNILCLEIGHNQGLSVNNLAINCNFYDKFVIIKDINGLDRIFLSYRD